MTIAWPRFHPVMVLVLVLGLAACQSAEDRAEGHYQNALALVADGDFDRAKVEFRNVFQNDGLHREARADYARLLRENQELQDSYSQYLRLVEQFPDDVEGRIALAEMSLLFQNFEEAERHGRRAISLAEEDPRTAVIALNLDYAAAVNEEDAPARRALAADAARLQQDDAENLLLMQLQIDNAVRERDLQTALEIVDAALTRAPANRQLQDIRLAALAELERTDELAPQLLSMIALFPEDDDLALTLLRFYLSREEPEQAIAFLRDRARTAESAERRHDARITLVQLVRELEGGDAAIAALDELIAETEESTAVLSGLRASIRFEDGDRERGLSEMQEILEGDLAVAEQGALRVALAQMLLQSGNPVGAQAQVEQVLEIDSVQVDALKMQATWFIEQDNPDEAIAVLRQALDERPSDAQALTLMAEAHTRNGNRELSREFLALAVEASNSAPDETIRFARVLTEQGSLLRAENLLIDALRLVPGDTALLSMLGNLYIDMEDWGRAEQVERTLRASGDPEQAQVADSLQTVRLATQGRMEDAIAFLEGIAAEAGAGNLGAQVAVIRARLANNETAEALALAEELRAENPDEAGFQFVLGATQIAAGELSAAEVTYRSLTETLPQAQPGWIGLIRTLNLQGRAEEAETALADALTQLPDALELLWAQASLRERAGDFEGAIALYEVMYERAPASEVIANNLASMLSTYRADDESLERAWSVARRLRGLDVPPFQDTYGWIAYRRGDFDEALDHLEPAAAALADNPLVQFHLGMTYAALERPAEALAQLQRAVEIAGPEDTRSQFETARAEIARLAELVPETSAETGVPAD